MQSDLFVWLKHVQMSPMVVQMVGPMMAEDAKPLPAELAAFLDQDIPHGHPAVYVSMGTYAQLNQHKCPAY